MSNTTAYKHIDPTTPDRLVHSSLLGKLFAEITIASIYNPDNVTVERLRVIADEMRDDLKAWRCEPLKTHDPGFVRCETEVERFQDEDKIYAKTPDALIQVQVQNFRRKVGTLRA